MSIPNNYPIGCSEEEIYNTIKEYQEAIRRNQSVTVIVQRAAAIIQIGEMELATRFSKKQGEITQELKESVSVLRKNVVDYGNASARETRSMFYLTIALGFIAVLQLFIAYKQMNLSEEQSISERIIQARNTQTAIELCNQDKTLKESGLFEVSTGRPASCGEVLRIYGGDNSLWSRIKNLFN